LKAEHIMARSTTRLVVQKAGGVHVGTGMFFGYRLAGGRTRAFCVTSRNLLSDALLCSLSVLVESGDDKAQEKLTFDVTDIASCAVFPPSAVLDLAAFPIDALFAPIAGLKKQPALKIIDRDLVPGAAFYAGLDASRDIVLMGYPNGLPGVNADVPVPQSGVTASSAMLPFDGKDEFLIECACYPGASGSPVFLHRPWDDAIVPLGILVLGAEVSAAGQIVPRAIPTSRSTPVTPQNMTRLGLCLKASLLSFLDAHVPEHGR
jgi:hypothetical protein